MVNTMPTLFLRCRHPYVLPVGTVTVTTVVDVVAKPTSTIVITLRCCAFPASSRRPLSEFQSVALVKDDRHAIQDTTE